MDTATQLKRDEGYRQHPYTDTVGKLTIGYGFNLTDDGLTEDECEAVLRIKIDKVRRALTAAFTFYSSMDIVRQSVLENLAYNMGFTRLRGFKNTLAAMAQGDWDTAADELSRSLWAEQVGERAYRLITQLRTGVWV